MNHFYQCLIQLGLSYRNDTQIIIERYTEHFSCSENASLVDIFYKQFWIKKS